MCNVSGKKIPWYYRRAGGRRKYNRERQDRAKWRRDQIPELAIKFQWTQAQIARHFGVHRSTINRDFQYWRKVPSFTVTEQQVKAIKETSRIIRLAMEGNKA